MQRRVFGVEKIVSSKGTAAGGACTFEEEVGGPYGHSKLRREPRKRRAWKGSCHWDGKR